MSQFSMDDLKKRIQEQTVISMGMMMPDEHLKQLVDEAITDFFNPWKNFTITELGSSWDRSQKTESNFKGSIFQLLVWGHVRGIVEKALNEFFTEQAEGLSAKIKETVRASIKEKTIESVAELAPTMSAIASLHAIDQATQHLRNQTSTTFSRIGVAMNNY